MRLAVFLAAAAVLTACSPAAPKPEADAPLVAEAPMTITPAGTPPTDAQLESAVASINPLENPLRNLEVAVRLPEAFDVKEDGAEVILKVKSDSLGVVVDERFTLTETSAADDRFTGPLEVDGFNVHTFALDPADGDRMAAAQAKMLELRASAPGENELTFDAMVLSCVAAGKTAPDVYRFSVFMRSAPSVEFVSMGGDMDVARNSAGALGSIWDACPA